MPMPLADATTPDENSTVVIKAPEGFSQGSLGGGLAEIYANAPLLRRVESGMKL